MCTEDINVSSKHFLKGLDCRNAEVASLRIIQVQQTIDLKVWDVCGIQKEKKSKEAFPY